MNVLFITHHLFCIDLKQGGKSCAKRNRDSLLAIPGTNVYTMFIVFADSSQVKLKENEFAVQGPESRMKSMLNYFRGYACITPRMEQDILQYIADHRIDLVFFDSSIFGQTIRRVRQETKAKSICYMHNVEAHYALNRVKSESFTYYPLYRAYALNEKLAVKYADYVICLNDRDARETDGLYGRRPEGIIPITFPDRLAGHPFEEKVEKKDHVDLLFIGSKFLPNVQGLRWFVNEVMPEVPGTLTVIGKDMETLREELSRDNVTVVGGVDDLGEYMLKYDAMVLPIFLGSGMKVKTAESMMYGKVIFATDEALVGYETIPGKIMRCNTKEEFTREIRRYLDAGVTRYSEQVRQQFKAKFTNEAVQQDFVDALNKLFPQKG